MTLSTTKKPIPTKLWAYALAMAIGWTTIVVVSLGWNLRLYTSEIKQIALSVTRANLEKDLLYRKWNSSHGGVYVPVTEDSQPNPYLFDHDVRDIKSEDGTLLTLINPAYMTRQIHDLSTDKSYATGHITSTTPLNPDNIADPWEAEALDFFKKGDKEHHDFTMIGGEEYVRLMIPLATEKDCLRCHEKEGYKVGDIIGGISIEAPMKPFWGAKKGTIRNIWTGHILFWLLGLLGAGSSFASLHFRIQEKQRIEQDLSNSEARYRELFDRMSSGVIVFVAKDTGNDFMAVDFNKAAELIEKISKRDVVDKSILEVFPSFKKLGVFDLLQRVYKTGKPELYETSEYRADKIFSWRENFAYKLPTDDIVLIFKDLTKLKMDEEHMQHTQKMEAIGTLAGGVAHDFNNILTAIIGYAELSLISTPKDSVVFDHLEKIIRSGKRATSLVRQILTFSRQNEQERKVILLQSSIKETLKLMRGTLPTTIEIRREIDSDCGPVLADITQIQQVLMNLCTNSYHAMRENGGVLTVKLKGVQVNQKAANKHSEMLPGKYAKISVKDTGHGMDSQTVKRIFDPYYTTKKLGEGTGLGLATVHGIVKNHDGVIDVISQPGKGTVFEIYLPIIDNPEIYEEPLETKISLSRITGRVLFVDDEPAIVQLGEKILLLLGCSVSAFTNSQEALEAFKAAPNDFDIVLTDQTMPGLTGIELSKKFLKIRPDIPIILCTGFSETVNEEQAKRAGIKEFILKPLTIHSITESVRKAMM